MTRISRSLGVAVAACLMLTQIAMEFLIVMMAARTTPNKLEPGLCGCGAPDSDLDTDLDGTPDCVDGCPNDPLKMNLVIVAAEPLKLTLTVTERQIA